MAVLRKLCALLVVYYFQATKPFHYSLFNVLLYAMYDFIMSTIFATMKIFSWMMQKESWNHIIGQQARAIVPRSSGPKHFLYSRDFGQVLLT